MGDLTALGYLDLGTQLVSKNTGELFCSVFVTVNKIGPTRRAAQTLEPRHPTCILASTGEVRDQSIRPPF